MTLILTIANERGVHQSSDYQLTGPRTGDPITDEAGSKQVTIPRQSPGALFM